MVFLRASIEKNHQKSSIFIKNLTFFNENGGESADQPASQSPAQPLPKSTPGGLAEIKKKKNHDFCKPMVFLRASIKKPSTN